MSPQELKIGTRGSQLALWQANTVAARLAAAGGPPCRIVVIRTSGDRLQDRPLSEVGGKRLFVKEIEDALLAGEVDLAVHSSKDMPALLPDGLEIGAVLPREDPRDAVVLGVTSSPTLADVAALVAHLGPAPDIGTSSVRRIAQLSRMLPGARFHPIRGNLDTRLRKLDAGEHSALVLAAAGLRRLGFESRISFALPAPIVIPAPGQGIVAVEVRSGDDATGTVVGRIDDQAARRALTAERSLVAALGGGCQTPIGALAADLEDGRLELVATVITLDGSRALRASGQAAWSAAADLGVAVAKTLLNDGAGDILADAQRHHQP